MLTIGKIELPITKVHTLYDNDVLDALFDLDYKQMPSILGQIHMTGVPQMLIVSKRTFYPATIIFMYKPPERWAKYEDQLYMAIIAKNIKMMKDYLIYHLNLSGESKEKQILKTLSNIIAQLEIKHSQTEQNNITSYSYNMSYL